MRERRGGNDIFLSRFCFSTHLPLKKKKKRLRHAPGHGRRPWPADLRRVPAAVVPRPGGRAVAPGQRPGDLAAGASFCLCSRRRRRKRRRRRGERQRKSKQRRRIRVPRLCQRRGHAPPLVQRLLQVGAPPRRAGGGQGPLLGGVFLRPAVELPGRAHSAGLRPPSEPRSSSVVPSDDLRGVPGGQVQEDARELRGRGGRGGGEAEEESGGRSGGGSGEKIVIFFVLFFLYFYLAR